MEKKSNIAVLIPCYNEAKTILLIISIIMVIPVFIEYFKTGLVPRFPTLIFSLFLTLMSVMLYVCGIILEVVVKKHRQLFELHLNEIKILKKK